MVKKLKIKEVYHFGNNRFDINTSEFKDYWHIDEYDIKKFVKHIANRFKADILEFDDGYELLFLSDKDYEYLENHYSELEDEFIEEYGDEDYEDDFDESINRNKYKKNRRNFR